MENIIYGDFVLDEINKLYISSIDMYNGGKIENNTYNKPDIDGVGLNSYFIREKTIKISGIIKDNSIEELEESMQELQKALATPNQKLKVFINNSNREQEAYCINLDSIFDERKHYNNTFIPFTIIFQIDDPFWSSEDMEEYEYNITGALQDDIDYEGTAIGEPIITITFNRANLVDEISFDIASYSLFIDQEITTNDVIIINSKEKQVYLNDEVIDYGGQLPLFQPGFNSFTLIINGTFECNVVLNYYVKYI